MVGEVADGEFAVGQADMESARAENRGDGGSAGDGDFHGVVGLVVDWLLAEVAPADHGGEGRESVVVPEQ